VLLHHLRVRHYAVFVTALASAAAIGGCGSSTQSTGPTSESNATATAAPEASAESHIRVKGRTCEQIVSVGDLESATGRTITPSDPSSYEEVDDERQCLYQVDGSELNELIIEASDDIAKGERLADAPVFDLRPLNGLGERAAISNSTLIALTDTGFLRVNAASSYFDSGQLQQISQLVFTGLTRK
jgi:hypothetical protein